MVMPSMTPLSDDIVSDDTALTLPPTRMVTAPVISIIQQSSRNGSFHPLQKTYVKIIIGDTVRKKKVFSSRKSNTPLDTIFSYL